MLKSILMLVTTGSLWVVVGAIVGLVGRKGLSLVQYQIIGGVLRIFVALGLGIFTSQQLMPPADLPASTLWIGIAGCIGYGFFNYIMIQLMGLAMERGPNAIVWAIIQSGFIYPFFMGLIIFGETMSTFRVIGIIFIIASVFLYAFRGKADKSPQNADGNAIASANVKVTYWLVPALLGMLFCGLNQCGGSLPSHLVRGEEIPSLFRDLITSVGGLIGCACGLVKLGIKGEMPKLPTMREFGMLAGFAILVLCVNFSAQVWLLFPGLDILTNEYHLGALGYPIMVASCIIAFFPYGLIVLREKINPIQAIGALVGIAGIALCCI